MLIKTGTRRRRTERKPLAFSTARVFIAQLDVMCVSSVPFRNVRSDHSYRIEFCDEHYRTCVIRTTRSANTLRWQSCRWATHKHIQRFIYAQPQEPNK